MGPNPSMISFALKAALAASLVLTVSCLLLTTGATPAAGAAEAVGDASSPPAPAEQAAEQAPASSEEIESCPLSSAYPDEVLRWCDLIVEFASQHSLPPELIAAVILQESGGDPQAYSSSGAVGLMQVMPRDGLAARFQCVNGPCFASRPTIAELQDPAYNIEFGARMLAGLLARHGDLRAALKAYGPMDMGYAYADIVLSIYDNYR
jgi:soluble lytic murein transglycosylase-like protein